MSQQLEVNLKALVCLDGVVLRLVEQQGAQATRRTTDSLDEQAWLEDFLETSKPELPSAEECLVRHRLLLTPFRYRKRHGSRFATRWERGLFYGSRSRWGCLLEGAYYELVFQDGPEQLFPRSSAMRKALFHVQMRTERGLKLQARLRDPLDSHLLPLNTTRHAAMRMWFRWEPSAAACSPAHRLTRSRWPSRPTDMRLPSDAWMTTRCTISSAINSKRIACCHSRWSDDDVVLLQQESSAWALGWLHFRVRGRVLIAAAMREHLIGA